MRTILTQERGKTMNIMNANQSMGFSPVSQQTQDSHEQQIQKQIMNLQEKMRDVTYSSEMSSEEKSNKKKALQEQIQSLNSELKQYQLRKRQEEAEKRQEEAARKQKEEASGQEAETADGRAAGADTAEEVVLFPESDASKAILSNSNTKEHLASLQKVRNDLEGKLRTADSEEEKARLRKRISNVSRGMGIKVQKIKDTVTDRQSDSQSPKNGSARSSHESREDSFVQGKVLITRQKN